MESCRWKLMDETTVAAALGAFFPTGREIEVRALWEGERHPKVKRGMGTGLMEFIKRADADQAKGIYVVMNPFGEVEGKAVADGDVLHREWLLVDIDPVRASGAAATKKELNASLRMMVDIHKWLVGLGWPKPFVGMSGNGAHLMWRVDLGTSEEDTELIQRCLQALAWRFDQESVSLVDQKVFNLSRIWKLPGTVSRKGIATKKRPWRTALLHKVGEGTVERSQLEELADSVDIGEPEETDEVELGRLRSWLHSNWPGLGEPVPYLGGKGRRWVFRECPWDAKHRDRAAYVIRFGSGAIIAGCLHENCKGHKRSKAGKSLGWRLLQKLAKKPFGKKEGVPDAGFYTASTMASPRMTQLGNSIRLARAYAGEMLFVPQWKAWLEWDGQRWIECAGHAERLAKTLSGLVFDEAERADANDEEKKAKALYKWAMAAEAQNQIMSALRLAESHLSFETLAERFDRDIWALNCQNGIVDLRSGKLEPHRRDALMTKVSEVDWSSDACLETLCPRWLEFLDVIFDYDVELIQFIQRAIGYCLTGSVREQVMFLCHGGGANGKTTFLRAVQHMLGDYATQIDSKLLMRSRNDVHPTGITDLMGKRFAGAAESDRGKQLAEAMIKQLTGDDIITARRMRQDFIRFRPTHKLWLLVNHKPIIKGNDLGIWRRLIYVPFTVTISEEQKDKDLLGKLEKEAEGILRWAIQGCLEWQRIGLAPPARVLKSAKDYREDMDLLKDFFEDCCVVGGEGRVSKKELYGVYCDWCEPRNNRPGNIKFFGRLMHERGFKDVVGKHQGGDGIRRSIQQWKGIRVGQEEVSNLIEVDFP